MLDLMGLEALLKSVGDDPAIMDLMGGEDALKGLRKRQALQGEQELRVAQAVLNVFNSEDGKVLFEYLVASTYRRFDNITAMGLRMDTAMQLHAERDGRTGLVNELLKLVKLAQNPPAQPKA